MRVKFEAQLERLNVELITMGALCEEVISGAAKALLDGLREQGILVRWWDKARISNCLRVSIGTDEEMETFCRVMEELLRQFPRA